MHYARMPSTNNNIQTDTVIHATDELQHCIPRAEWQHPTCCQ